MLSFWGWGCKDFAFWLLGSVSQPAMQGGEYAQPGPEVHFICLYLAIYFI